MATLNLSFLVAYDMIDQLSIILVGVTSRISTLSTHCTNSIFWCNLLLKTCKGEKYLMPILVTLPEFMKNAWLQNYYKF